MRRDQVRTKEKYTETRTEIHEAGIRRVGRNTHGMDIWWIFLSQPMQYLHSGFTYRYRPVSLVPHLPMLKTPSIFENNALPMITKYIRLANVPH